MPFICGGGGTDRLLIMFATASPLSVDNRHNTPYIPTFSTLRKAEKWHGMGAGGYAYARLVHHCFLV